MDEDSCVVAVAVAVASAVSLVVTGVVLKKSAEKEEALQDWKGSEPEEAWPRIITSESMSELQLELM